MKICIFEEDIDKIENLYPLTLTRPVFELKCGYTTLSERITRNFEGEELCASSATIYFFLREYLVPTFKNRTGANVIDGNNLPELCASSATDDFLFINGRWLMNKGELGIDGPEEIGVCGEEVAYIRATQQTIQSSLADTPEAFYSNLKAQLPKKEIKATLISYPWDLISNNPDAMIADFEFLGKKGVLGEFSELSTIYGGSEDDVYVAESAEVQPLVVLDVTHGPIFIDEGAVIFPHTRIEGPAYIGKDTRIVGGKIREGTSIGPVCRVGGEVEEAIIHGYSNKYHDGFLGHAYVGEWVNLGALTTNSDLKNDYTTVEVYVKGKLMDSDDTKVGCFIGDHTKTGLGTFFNTGTVVGVMSNVLPAGGLLPKLIPSFCIAHEGRFLRGRLKDLLATAKTAMGRRDVELTQEDIQLFERLYELTKEERNEWIKKTRR